MTVAAMAPGPDGGPATPVKIVPSDFHSVAQQFIDAQNDLERIRQDLLNGLDAAKGAAGACDGAHQYENGWAAALDCVVNDGFHSAFDLLGSIGRGIDISALNHTTADQDSVPGGAGGQPRTPLAANPWQANSDFVVLTDSSPWWMPSFLEKYIPTADTGRIDDAAAACRKAAGAIRDLVAHLHTLLQGLISNNSSEDVTALEEFWQRAAGPPSTLTQLPQILDQLADSLIDFRVWNTDTQEKIKEKIKSVIDALGIVGILLAVGSIITDGALDVLLIGVVEALELFGVDAAGALVVPIAEVVTAAETILVVAGGAVAITQGVVPAMRTAMSSTPDPNVEGVDATKIGDELADRGLPELKYPKNQLQAKFKHAKDFDVEQNWSVNEGAKAYEDALRKFADDPVNTVNAAGKYHGNPAILIYNEAKGLCEVLRPDGTFWTGWKLSPEQMKYVVTKGTLGGGG